MAKTRVRYVCSECGRQSPSWFGRCPGCGEFNTMETQDEPEGRAAAGSAGLTTGSAPQRLGEVEGGDGERIPVPLAEFSRVLGGGFVPGSITLIGGEPGIGKSTLILQLGALLADALGPVLYVSGEESARQIRMRADRLALQADELYLLTETQLETVLAQVGRIGPRLLVIDSIQTMQGEASGSAPGSVSQVRDCAGRLQVLAKASGICVVLIGHVTREGSIAGPRVLEHLVDTVLYMEGDPFQAYRLLRCVKNRFGAASEVGVFEMQGRGLIEVPNPSEVFLAERSFRAPGSAITITLEGTRPLLVELQALASPSVFSNPRRTPNGVDANRLLLISAVLAKRAGLRLQEQDLFVNVIGGLKVSEPAADLALAAALASSFHELPLPADLVLIGELGLGGELRAVSQSGPRLREAARLGFKRALLPRLRRPLPDALPELELLQARDLMTALKLAGLTAGRAVQSR
ncbi:MAG: DNA repair protein RadA [Anaerolineae bacterium]|nr:DNA repair protein RadA [Anaerolineae bacterium]